MSGSVVITGGRGGLGRALAAEFEGASWQVEAPGRDELDVCSDESVAQYFSGRELDLLICTAGLTRDASLIRLSEQSWDLVCETNFLGAARCAKWASDGMRERKGGHIIFISSYSAIHPPVGQAAYAASKAALLGLTQGLAIELGPMGIRVNAVLPGFMETPMTCAVSDERRIEILSDHSLGRFNTPTIVSKFIRHLQEDLVHTSGQVFNLDSRLA
ncbi:MAG: SDR family oxidoreductase [Verrucomicrobiales bacterium VVV1]|nr:MAG: SDR family oxidoreductase [Verrucomicrobiales bacterium VVV1]